MRRLIAILLFSLLAPLPLTAGDLGFQVPGSWQAGGRDGVEAVSPAADALVHRSTPDAATPAEAADQFFSQEGITLDQSWRGEVRGTPALWYRFRATDGVDPYQGLVVFFEHRGKVQQVVAVTDEAVWPDYAEMLEKALLNISHRQ